MEKKAKIIATLGPAIYSNTKLKQLVNLGVDAFRINFSHNTKEITKIVSKIRKIEKFTNKKLSLIADLQGVKLRVGNIKEDSQRIKYNQKYIFDLKKNMQTLPLIHIFNKLSKSELNKLKRKLKHHLNRSDIKAIKKIIIDEGGVDFAEKKIKRLSNEAEKELDIFPDSPYKKALISILTFNINRMK